EICGQRLRHTGVAGHDPQRGLVGNPLDPQADWRHHQPLFEDAGGPGGHRARPGTADVVVVAEGLDEGHDHALVEHRDRDAQVRQVADAALGGVDVVVDRDGTIVYGGQRVL